MAGHRPIITRKRHSDSLDTASDLLPVREFIMLAIMDRLADEPDAFQELRSKAAYLEQSGLIPTLGASATVVEPTVAIGQDLRDSLKMAIDRLQYDQSLDPDWHPDSGDMAQDLVHSSTYPLVCRQSRVLREKTSGGSDAIDKWPGKGEVNQAEQTTYQWLPSRVAFQDDGSVATTQGRLLASLNCLWLDSLFETSPDSQKLAIDKMPAELLQFLNEKGILLDEENQEKEFAPPFELLDYVCRSFHSGIDEPRRGKRALLDVDEEADGMPNGDEVSSAYTNGTWDVLG
ncbi:hypothetical protein BD289DRAFT_486289 [Coniella lustricola]|uniref:DUF4246 domain-containing protein n=1 Tax=Coniella lustricola TaxID=2025994 RepID=A0A2T2ZVL9_9PEZI|nr:hypothetical protein BD289DRAFT_486289 [Coniella lustricola]